MSLWSSAGTVRKAVKNAGRLREILGAATRFGFGTLVARLPLAAYKDKAPGDSTEQLQREPLPARLRMLFEGLGPTFIKVGQILAGRPDLIPAEIVREFERLQDRTTPVSFAQLKPVLEGELDRPLAECFSSFDTEPLATASIAQVHAARTLEGDDVVVKIRKPDVERLLEQDMEILEFLAGLLERYIPELRPFRPSEIVQEFKRSLLAETDFRMEANNIRRFRENFASSAFLVIPKVYTDLSSDHVITMERLRGVPLRDLEAVRAMGVDPRELLRGGMDAFFQSVMSDGLFHADPHAGNIIAMPDGRMGLIDFGSVGRLSQRSKDAIINMFLALVTEDYDALMLEYLDLSPPVNGSRSTTNIERIQREVAALMSPYHGLPLAEIPAGRVLMDATRVAFRHQVSLPRDLVLVFKAIMTLEGIGRSLDPDFDLLGAASKYSRILIKERYNPTRLLKDALFLTRDLSRLVKTAPRQLGEALRQLESGELTLNHNLAGLEEHGRSQVRAGNRIALSILAVGWLLCATFLFAHPGVPLWTQIVVGATAVFLATFSFLRSWN